MVLYREIHYDRASIDSLIKVLISLGREKSQIQTAHRVALLSLRWLNISRYIYIKILVT